MAILGNGSSLIIFNATTGDPIACQRGVTVTFNDATIDVTCKQDNGFTNLLPGLRSFTITADALTDFQNPLNTEGIVELTTLYTTRGQIEVNIADPTNTDIYYNGLGYIESLELNAGLEDVASYTATITGTGTFVSLVS